jgi:hypothetical protein
LEWQALPGEKDCVLQYFDMAMLNITAECTGMAQQLQVWQSMVGWIWWQGIQLL